MQRPARNPRTSAPEAVILRDVYITSLGTFLPGKPIGNDEMEAYLGRIQGKPSRARARVLKQNGIQTRHYAIDTQQRSLFRNSEMAALAVRDALTRRQRPLEQVDFLAAATTQGDLCVPGFGSMVHGELKNPTCEIASLHGVCASGIMALRSAMLQVKAEERQLALACASEFPSRLFKASRFTAQLGEDGELPFDTEFLRWMLSDGAGAAVLEPAPRSEGLSLKLEWIELRSHAHQYGVCMYAGANTSPQGELGPSWLDFPSFEAASREGAINLKQDIRLLDNMVKIGVDGYFDLLERGRLTPDFDHFVCHYSSHFFREQIRRLLEQAGASIPEEKWFTNLYTKGNVGCASIYVLLEELFHSGKLQPGQRIFCMVPESGRFIASYMLLTVVGQEAPVRPALPPVTPAGPPALQVNTTDPLQASLVRQLTRVWIDFEARLHQVPIVARLERGQLTVEDYRLLLLNLRQQVAEGARWIARAASHIELSAFPLRSLFITHAREEHRDFQMLERDYVSVGGNLEDIQNGQKNVGSEALSAWMFQRASQPNPFDLMGAMFIIEGLGSRLARGWGERIREQLGLADSQVSFLLYHGSNDESHLDKLETAVQSGLLTEALVERVVKTAKVTARLYLLQLEELGNV
ncbi:3-oxoacyl-[acyl-carrier-protein] synthase III C-terminal domain-containing protein [Archangium violaceum]|uniref:3-oxoacyl-[acyl-carrier-protein] synthase III C-terminal domain-containing protein n=1 Tax=Archangium violaceum TaxID=83451 RepID=UPI002B2E5B63|nr:3-oxoacyl-[acyl-carrier-protein] synthase III C-terminal domain-containing protein [Archangium gephyra]